MRKTLGHLALGVSLGVLVASSVVSEAKAATYHVVVTVTDTTTMAPSGSFTIVDNVSNDSNPVAGVIQQATPETEAGVIVQGISSSATSSGDTASLSIGGELKVTTTSTDSYSVVVQTFYSGYTSPMSGMTNTLSQTTSGSYGNVTTPGSQSFNSWFNPGTTTTFPSGGTTPGPLTFPIPAGGSTGGSAGPNSTTVPSYTPPFTLSDQVTVTFKANGAGTIDLHFSGTTSLQALTVPEPASIVMFLTGMPVPLLILGLLQRRKAAAAKG